MKKRDTPRRPARLQVTPIRELLDGPALLNRIWPDERSRPSLRWLRTQQKFGIVPVVRCGRRALFCPGQVRDAIQQRFTVLPKAWGREGGTAWDLPALGTLTDAVGLLNWLNAALRLRRSLRWLREQQRARSLPFVKLGARVFFSAEQVRFVLERVGDRDGARRFRRDNELSTDLHQREGKLVTIRIPWFLCTSKIYVRSDIDPNVKIFTPRTVGTASVATGVK
jgi:hypothetical protein